MNSKRYTLFTVLSLLASAAMLFFTFFAWGWFSDIGMRFYFEIPVSTQKGFFTAFSDTVWMAVPFFSVIASALYLARPGKALQLLGTALGSLPFALYALLQFFAVLGEETVHTSVLISHFFILLCAFFAMASFFLREIRPFALHFYAGYGLLEILLLILSALLDQKLSPYYFYQVIPIGHSGFHYRFFTISVFLYQIFYLLSLILRSLAGPVPPPSDPPEKNVEEEPSAEDEEEESDLSSLTLQDFGIEK